MFNLQQFKDEPMQRNVFVEVIFIASQDDGYGSWNQQDERHRVAETLDDPHILEKIAEVIHRIESRDSVQKKLQRPIFNLTVTHSKTARMIEL